VEGELEVVVSKFTIHAVEATLNGFCVNSCLSKEC
jgi:hypothetical protein